MKIQSIELVNGGHKNDREFNRFSKDDYSIEIFESEEDGWFVVLYDDDTKVRINPQHVTLVQYV